MSRVLKNIQFHYTGLHPKARLVIRMLMVQLSNAYYLYRLYLTRDYFRENGSNQVKSYISWRQKGAKLMTMGKFLELLLASEYGKARTSGGHLTSSSRTRVSANSSEAVAKTVGSTRRRHLFDKRELKSLRMTGSDQEHQVLFFTTSKRPRQGQITGNPGWCALCGSGAGAARKRVKMAREEGQPKTVPDKTGRNKSRYKCLTCQVFLCDEVRSPHTKTCWKIWHSSRRVST